MSIKVTVPELGESVVEATVGRWHKQEGDRVAVGETLVELETDKVNLEVSAQQAGVLSRIERHEGDDVQIGDVLAVIEAVSETVSAGPAYSAPRAEPAAQPAPPPPSDGETPGADKATPVARRMADEHGVDLRQVPPAGPGDRLTRQDVQGYLQRRQAEDPAQQPAPAPTAGPPPAAPARPDREERLRMSRRRRTIAQRLVEAQHRAAMLTTFNEVDMSAVMEVRQRRRDSFQERHGIRLGFMSFFVKAVIGALKSFPQVNAEIQGDEIVLKHYYDIGIAVGTPEGLVVPVLREADRLSFAEIERTIREFSEKAGSGSLSLEDLRGGTFTITNGGVFGSLLSTPILNPPQVGILGMHKIEERPIARDGQVVIRPMMYVALSYDHRIVDGREAVQFLVRIKELIEDPESLLLEG